MSHSICIRAFAKINLGLKILRRLPDRFHEIRTVYQTIALHDRVELTLRPASRARGIEVECDDPRVPLGRRNLVYQACRLWKQARRYRGGIRVRLEKRIPQGSGLGGASSDAAATLLGLERVTGEKLDASARFQLAARLGSDVPLFLLGGRVLGCGRGEEVYPLADLRPRKCLVLYPGFAISTAEAYREADFRLTKIRRGSTIFVFGAWPRFPQDGWGPAENDFEQVVFARWPELGEMKTQLIRAGAEIASLTGSGSGLYALFASTRKFARAQTWVPREWQTYRTRTLARAEYRRLLFER